MSAPHATISGDVRISGAINDVEFSASGNASGDPETGAYSVTLNYDRVPEGWHPLMYTDVKVSLLFLREDRGAKNFLTLAGGTYRSAGHIDLGNGNVLINHTHIRMLDKHRFDAVYVMSGRAHTGDLTSMDFFEETMLPFGPGRIAALAVARWTRRDGTKLDALFSTKYTFDEKHALDRAQVRRIEARPTLKGNAFASTYNGFVRVLPRMVDDGGPYIGHLIA